MTPEQQALIERAAKQAASLRNTAQTWRQDSLNTWALSCEQDAELFMALAAELKQATEENKKLTAQLNLAHAAYDPLTSDSDALRSKLADVEQALRAEKALSRLLSAEQEKTGAILGWQDGESTSEAATRLREQSA